MEPKKESTFDCFCRRKWHFLIGLLLIFSAAVSIYGSGLNYFYDIDEPKYARAVYEMVSAGNPLAPMFDGIPRMEKPPLTYWVMYPFAWLASYDGFGGNALFLLRLPAVICSILMVLGTALIGRRLFGPGTGLLAGVILQSSVLFKFMSVMMKVDVVFACTMTWIIYFYLKRFLGDKSVRTASAGTILTALGMLAKGPCVFLPMAGYALAVGIRTNQRRLDESGRPVTFFSSLSFNGLAHALRQEHKILLLWLIVGSIPFLLWLGAVQSSSGINYLSGMLGELSHNTSATGSKFLYRLNRFDPYFDTLTSIFFPWGAYLFGTVNDIWEKIKKRHDEKLIFMVCVFLIYLLVFTLFFKLKAKRYMLPMLPLLSILISNWLLNACRDKTYRNLFAVGFGWICLIAGLFSYRSFKFSSVSVNLSDRVPVGQYMELMTPFFIALCCFLAVFLVVSLMQRERPVLHILVGALAITGVMPFYYQTLPSYTSLAENRPYPILGKALIDRVAEVAEGETLILHRPDFVKKFPDMLYYIKNISHDGKPSYSLGYKAGPAEFIQALSAPGTAGEVFCREHADADKYPAYNFFRNTGFNDAVLLLDPEEYPEFEAYLKIMPPKISNRIKVEKIELLTIKWVVINVYLVHWQPEDEISVQNNG